VLACSSHVVPVVSVAMLPVSPQSGVDATLLNECRITGTGEREHEPEDGVHARFEVFATRVSKDASLVIAQPGAVAVSWSHFPAPSEAKGRAMAGLGGQKHIRFDGWASLHDRTFSAQKRLYAEPGRLWARVGAPIEMLGADGNVAVAHVETPFASPKRLLVRGACDTIAYEPEAPARGKSGEKKSIGMGTSRTATLALFASPSGQPFTTLTFDADFTLGFDIMERHEGFVRIAGEAGEVGFDAWVRASDIEEDTLGTINMHGFGSSSCGGASSADHGIVARDAPLFVGKTPVALAGAFVEKDAELRFLWNDTQTVDGRTYLAFDFEDFMISAPEDQRMWIAKDLVERR
jgi:hypothetical protein